METLTAGKDFDGSPLKVDYDLGSDALLISTRHKVWLSRPGLHLEGRKLDQVKLDGLEGPGRVSVAPGGRFIVGFSPSGAALSTATIFSTASRAPGIPASLEYSLHQVTRLEGVRHVYLGYRGESILTAKPLDTLEGITGRWEWILRDGNGVRVHRIVREGMRGVVREPTGRFFALLGPDDYELLDRDGTLQGPVRGRFRAMKISDGARVLLLNGADSIDEVLIVTGPQSRKVRAGAPVHGMLISPDGSRALVWYRDGWVRELSPATRRLGDAVRLVDDGYAFISSGTLDNDGRAAFGLLRSASNKERFSRGEVVVMRNGVVLGRAAVTVDHATSSVPGVIAAGEGRLAVWTFERVSLIKVP
jgi:hypothetical protein